MTTPAIRAALERLLQVVKPEYNETDEIIAVVQAITAARVALATEPLDPAGGGEALLAAAPLAAEAQREAVMQAVAEALGGAYDCLRVWEAWSVGTMGPDDFALVAEDDARLAEIADAAIQAMRPAAPADGEAGKLAASLRRIAAQNPMGIAVQAIASSATPLEQLATAPTAPPKGEAGDLVAWLNDGELVAWLNNHAAHLRTMEGIGALPETELQERLDRAATLIQQQAAELAALRAGVVLVAVSERLPEPNVKVLAHYFNALAKGRTVCAIWVPAKSRSNDDGLADEDFAEYDEEDDKYYWPEGWYEAIENWDDLGWVKIDEGEVVYWQPLPKWPAHALPLPAPQGGEVV